MKTNVYVLCGGKSVEHRVSLISASAIINSLDKKKYHVYPIYISDEGIWSNLGIVEDEIKEISELMYQSSNTVISSIETFLRSSFNEREQNIVFPALHGTNGEDGTIQGLLEILDIPYVGNGVMSSAIGIDKVVTKDLFAKHNIPQGKYTRLLQHQWKKDKLFSIERIEETIGYPAYVKPASLGSSVGINRCANREELEAAIHEAFSFEDKLVIEEEIIGREMQISVVGNEFPKASVVGEFIQERQFMDYAAKYTDGKLIQVIPAKLTEKVSELMREVAIKSFDVLNCSGLVRVDYFVTDDERFYVNEVNTMPGFTKLSMTPALWEKTDQTTYPELIEKLINLAFERYNKRKSFLYKRK
ncbi:D-alanine--D-alanine ligase [Alkaliphilus metalliredigens QYMF]|uniref:D-alanine--D-alanine ligase n=1 Tax=Alkaliphilus metalliredigens (strain QYMF) TaxID=293826 RepID=A6TUG2_ALKMQ|nr:D-alanine--D-alanine ligase [Alkaliphilus metalliredigens]ABR49830.1 D-alanine--D-alanine ligase [Alkaliphilus metalliredigens QYMF]